MTYEDELRKSGINSHFLICPLRYHAKLPVWPEDDELIDDWVDLIAQLPAAEEQGRLAQAIAEADRYAGAELDQP